MITDDILLKYQQCKSMKKTAQELSISGSAVKKTLITAGVYTTPLVEQIKEYVATGFTDKDIAALLGKSVKVINANKAYRRGTYLDDNKSEKAIKIKESREKKKREQLPFLDF